MHVVAFWITAISSLNPGKVLEVETVLAGMLRRPSGSAAHAACQNT